MGHWDDVSTVRAALRHGRGKQAANAFRAEPHGAIFLALDPSERTQLVTSSSAVAHRAHELARALVREGRLGPALGVYEVVVAALPYSFDALALLEALALAARIEALEPARLRGLIDRAWCSPAWTRPRRCWETRPCSPRWCPRASRTRSSSRPVP